MDWCLLSLLVCAASGAELGAHKPQEFPVLGAHPAPLCAQGVELLFLEQVMNRRGGICALSKGTSTHPSHQELQED